MSGRAREPRRAIPQTRAFAPSRTRAQNSSTPRWRGHIYVLRCGLRLPSFFPPSLSAARLSLLGRLAASSPLNAAPGTARSVERHGGWWSGHQPTRILLASSQVKSRVTPRGNMKAARSVNHRGLLGGGRLRVCMRRPSTICR
jgi:hypothetical protein